MDAWSLVSLLVPALVTVVVTLINSRRITNLHILVNSRMDAMLERMRAEGFAAGKLEEKIEREARDGKQ